MNEKLLKEILEELGSIYANIPNEVSTGDLEDKLDRLIELMENQNEISENISDKLNRVHEDMPETTYISTTLIETRLESIWEKLDNMNDALNGIQYNSDN